MRRDYKKLSHLVDVPTPAAGQFLKRNTGDTAFEWTDAPEDKANKDTDTSLSANSDTKYPSQKAVKTYVDNAVPRSSKVPVRFAITYNINLATVGLNPPYGTGSLNDGDRILVAGQTDGTQNGIYNAHSGAWTRATDFDSTSDVTSGCTIWVEQGDYYGDTGFILVTDTPITLGSTSLVFKNKIGLFEFTGDPYYGGRGFLCGDTTGNGRGSGAADIQSKRTGVTRVASGSDSAAVGVDNKTSGSNSSAIGVRNDATGAFSTASGYSNEAFGGQSVASGYNNTSSGDYAIAIGADNNVSGWYSTAIGVGCTASGYNANAFGRSAVTRIEKTTVINGPQINRKDAGESSGVAFETFNGVEVVLMSKDVGLTSTGTITISIPSGAEFFVDEVGVIANTVSGMTVQPTISFGITGNNAKYLAATQTDKLTAANKRERFTTLLTYDDGEASLTAAVVTPATATTMTGRFYWKGILLEKQ